MVYLLTANDGFINPDTRGIIWTGMESSEGLKFLFVVFCIWRECFHDFEDIV